MTFQQIKNMGSKLHHAHFRLLTIIYIIPTVLFACSMLLGQNARIITWLALPYTATGCSYCAMRLVLGQEIRFADAFYFYTSPARLGKAYLFCMLPNAVLSAGGAAMGTGFIARAPLLIILISVCSFIASIWLYILQYQLVLNPGVGLRQGFGAIPKLLGYAMRLLGLGWSLMWKPALVGTILLLLVTGRTGAGGTAIIGSVPMIAVFALFSLFYAPFVGLCTCIFMYEVLTGKPAAPEKGGKNRMAEDKFMKLSEQFNTCEGMRTNAALGVIGGVSPSELMPEPEERELGEGEDAQSEDWNALYGEGRGEEDEHGDAQSEDWNALYGEDWSEEDERAAQAMDEAQRYEYGEILLERSVLSASVEMDTISGVTAEALLGAVEGLPGYVRDDPALHKLVAGVRAAALEDLRGYEKAPRKGIAADDRKLSGGNKIRLVLRLEENSAPLPCKATAELYINER